MSRYSSLKQAIRNFPIFGRRRHQVYRSRYFSVHATGGNVRIETPEGAALIDGLTFSYSLCEIFSLRGPVTDPDQIVLDKSGSLAVGDEILVAQNFYGGAGLDTYQWFCEVVSVDVESSAIKIENPLPKHLLKNHNGLVVVKRHSGSAVAVVSAPVLVEEAGEASLSFAVRSQHFQSNVTLKMSDDSPRIDVELEAEFLSNCQLFNLSVCLDTELPLTDVYLKNRKIRDAADLPPSDDIWLGKEGCRFGGQDSCWLTLHNPALASLEIITSGKGFGWKTIQTQEQPRIVMNLEHYHAQRFRKHVEKRDETLFDFEELSAPAFRAGTVKGYSFNLFCGERLPEPPRLMPTPHGFRAAHAWTEHADKTTLASNRAAYFGHEDRTSSKEATGGFVKFGHVVTKSIFHDNPRCYQNSIVIEGKPQKVGAMLSFRTDEHFPEFLDDIHAQGHEICLHTATPDDCSASETRAGLAEISKRYKSSNWIDHDLQTVRSCFGFQGLDPSSDSYMVDIWRDNRIRYFWSWGSEDFAPRKKDIIDLLHTSSGDHTVTPLYWRSPGVSEEFITWAANECPLSYFSDQTIDKLITDRGISVHHHYYPYLPCERYDFGFITRDRSGKYRTTEVFDSTLSMMAERRDAGELLITTVGEFLDYWLALEKVRFDLRPPDTIVLENASGASIPGCAFVVRGALVSSNDIDLRSREIDEGDQLVWFDFPPETCLSFALSSK